MFSNTGVVPIMMTDVKSPFAAPYKRYRTASSMLFPAKSAAIIAATAPVITIASIALA